MIHGERLPRDPETVVEISQSTLTAGRGGEAPVEGRVESVRDGVAVVRVSAHQVVQASLDPEAGAVGVGAKVSLELKGDGTVVARPSGPAGNAKGVELTRQAWASLLATLQETVGEAEAGRLAKPLANGDLDGARRQVERIWNEIRALPPDQVAVPLRAWLEKSLPALLSRSGEAPDLTGVVSVRLGAAAAAPGEDRAEIAGRAARVLGPAGLEEGTKGVWQTRRIPGGGALWTPAATEAIKPAPVLPARVSADAPGARQLLEWAGVESSSEAEASLGAFLGRAAEAFRRAGREPTVAGMAVPGTPGDASSSPRGSVTESIVTENVAAKAAKDVPDLPREVARRALVAWSLGLPDATPVQQAVVGGGPSLPDALAELKTRMDQSPLTHPALRGILRTWEEQEWVAPAGLKAHGQGKPLRERLAEAVMEALARPASEPEFAAAPLREALQKTASALVQEALEPPRDGPESAPPAVFQARDGQGRAQEGRIVVHDRRERAGRRAEADDHHKVEIEMNPAVLGSIRAILELRGKTLTTRLEAKEADTARLIGEHADELREAFRKIGLEPAPIEVRRPAVSESNGPRRRGSGGHLDLHA